MDYSKLMAKLAEVTRISVDDLSDETPIAPADWDSVDVLDLISVIDESFGITVPLEKVNATHTIGELLALLRENA